MTNFDQSMYEYILENTKGFSLNSKSLYFYGRYITKQSFVKEVEKLAAFLQAKGIKKGDNIVICLGNIPNAIIAFYATNIIGAIANVLHPLIKDAQLKEIIDKMQPKAFFMFDEFYKEYTCLSDVKELIVVCSAIDYLPIVFKPFYGLATLSKKIGIKYHDSMVKYKHAKADNFKKVQINGEDIAIYMHSSGTTGKSKIAEISNSAMNNLASNLCQTVFEVDTLGPSWGMLMALPIFHTFGLGVCMHTILSIGARVILMPKFNATYASILMGLTPVKMISGVPNMFRKLAECKLFKGKKLQKLSECFCGGDKLPDDVKKAFEAKLRAVKNNMCIAEGYGLTEAGVCILNTQKNAMENSIGAPLNNTEIRIFDDANLPLLDNNKGYICVSSKSLMSGYYKDQDETNKIVFNYDGKTWLNTKDIGYIKDNHIFFVDREKRLIKISGNNVFPQEIENLVNSIEEIKISCATSYQEKEKTFIRLYVQMQENCILNNTVKEKIFNIIEKNLLKYARPKEIVQIENMPLTQIGKVNFNFFNKK